MAHGFYIRMEDLEELTKMHTHFPTRQIKGVRVYFTFDAPQKKRRSRDAITALFVPVYDATTEVEAADQAAGEGPGSVRTRKKPYLRDLVVTVEHQPGSGTDPLDHYVSVYDVTSPCPPACDTTSPLYGAL